MDDLVLHGTPEWREQVFKTDFSLTNAKFNDFLFEPIGDDARGITISMFSGFARLNLDPWREAARIAALPVDLARRAIAERLTQLNLGTPDLGEQGDRVTRLVGLLPVRGRLVEMPNETSSFRSLATVAPWLIVLAAVGLFLVMSLVGGETSEFEPTYGNIPGLNSAQ